MFRQYLEDVAKRFGIFEHIIFGDGVESANFDSLTLKTLHKFSRAFDVHLHVSFIPFSKGILDTSNLTSNRLRVSPRNEDLASSKDRTFRINFNGEWHSAPPIESTVTVARDATVETREWKLNESRVVTHE